MLKKLSDVLTGELEGLLQMPERWDSLLINRRKPHTYRVFTELENGSRICLHKFNVCDEHEAFEHPHPWPAAFVIMDGRYLMKFGQSLDRTSKPNHMENIIFSKFSCYEITNPLTWHAVIPLSDTYTIMINDKPWDADTAHTEVRTTKGKDLDKMPEHELRAFLGRFQIYLQLWKEHYVQNN